MSHPWLSVIMPTYDGGRYLRHALDAIVAQDDDSIEVIVVDDGSRDDTVAIAASYQPKLALRVESRGHCGNWVANTNHGMRLARGEYMSILHQDDAWRSKRLATLKRLVRRHPSAAVYVHPCWYMDGAGRRIGYWHVPFPRGATVLQPRQVLPPLLVQCLYGMPAPLFRTRLAREVGLMDESLWFSADWDFWLKLTRAGKTVYCPTPLAMFRLHPASQTILRGRHTDEVCQQQLLVQHRHWPFVEDGAATFELRRVATFSTEVNAALLRFVDGHPVDVSRLARAFMTLGPSGWLRYFRDSRILERCLSRLQAGAVRWRGDGAPRQFAPASLAGRRAPTALAATASRGIPPRISIS